MCCSPPGLVIHFPDPCVFTQICITKTRLKCGLISVLPGPTTHIHIRIYVYVPHTIHSLKTSSQHRNSNLIPNTICLFQHTVANTTPVTST